MINSKLLRKGSHVQVNGNQYKIHATDSELGVEAILLPGGPPEKFSFEDLEPIPISDEYLSTYNVKKDKDGKFHSRGNIIYQQENDKWIVMTQIKPNEYEAHPDLEYIHELQFFSMENTGENPEFFGQF